MSRSVIVAGSRTAIGKLSGQFAGLTAMDLGGAAIRGVLERTGVDPASVDAVLMGQVLQAGQGQITARQAAVIAGIPMTRARDDDQQGLPVGAPDHPPGRPDGTRGRGRGHRRRAAWSR